MKKTTVFRIADLDHPMYHADSFDDFEKAKKVLDDQYTNRNKKDGHDEYWRGRNTGIEKVVTTVEVLFSNKN